MVHNTALAIADNCPPSIGMPSTPPYIGLREYAGKRASAPPRAGRCSVVFLFYFFSPSLLKNPSSYFPGRPVVAGVCPAPPPDSCLRLFYRDWAQHSHNSRTFAVTCILALWLVPQVHGGIYLLYLSIMPVRIQYSVLHVMYEYEIPRFYTLAAMVHRQVLASQFDARYGDTATCKQQPERTRHQRTYFLTTAVVGTA